MMTRDVIYLLAQENATIYQALSLYGRGDVSWDDMMIGLVAALAEQNKKLTELLTDAMAKAPPAPVIIRRT